MGKFVGVAHGIQADLPDPFPRPRFTLLASDTGAFETERDIVEHGAIVEGGVILKHHAAVGSGTFDWLAHHLDGAGGGWELRTQTRDQPQDGGFSATRRTQ